MYNDEKSILIIPAYQPDERLTALVEGIRGISGLHIIVVNDGSHPKCDLVFTTLEEEYGCELLSHMHNMGKGAAIKTAIRHILRIYPDCGGCVTADADYQHNPRDILRVADEMISNPDFLTLGVRDFSIGKIPLRSLWGNRLTSRVFELKTGASCPDTQTGLRGIPAKYMDDFLHIPGNRFEYEMNMLLEAARMKVRFFQVPIETIYYEGNTSSHFHPIFDSVRIYTGFLRYGLSSIASAAVDLLLFSLMVRLLFGGSTAGIILSTVIARIFSGICNFTINKRWVFASRGNAVPEIAKYLVLFITQMALSGIIVALTAPLPLPLPLLKIATDTGLFFLSYYVQKKVVFRHTAHRGVIK